MARISLNRFRNLLDGGVEEFGPVLQTEAARGVRAPARPRKIVHIHMNGFYAFVEQRNDLRARFRMKLESSECVPRCSPFAPTISFRISPYRAESRQVRDTFAGTLTSTAVFQTPLTGMALFG
jgi:hypothetical protein